MKLRLISLALIILAFASCRNNSTAPATTTTGWTMGSFGTTQSILGLCFPLNNGQTIGSTALACGTSGTILRSQDSGKTWQSLVSGTSQDLYRISSIMQYNSQAQQNQITAVVGGNNGTLLRTTDGGATWTSISAPFQTVGGNLESIRDLKFLDANHVMIVGGVGNVTSPPTQGFVMVSSDAGVTWNRVKTTSIGLYSIGTDYGRNYPGYGWGYFHVVGALGQIYMTSDGGMTWADQSVAGQDFLATDFAGLQPGFAVSAQGGIYYTPDGGTVSWNQQSSGVSSALRTIYIESAQSPNEAWTAGDNGVILHKTNAGNSWTRADINGVSVSWNDIVVRDPHTLAFVGANGTLYWYTH